MTRCGLIARGDRTGLGTQTQGLYKNLMGEGRRPDATLVVDLSNCSGQLPDMALYAGDPNVSIWHNRHYPSLDLVADPQIEQFLDQVDVVFTCETFYNWWFVQRAREKGVRTIAQHNAEFFEHFQRPDLPLPDVVAMPSVWMLDRIRAAVPRGYVIHLPVPVDRELLPFRRRTSLQSILHTVGTGTGEDRNGTLSLIEAMRYVKSDVTCVIKTQRYRADVCPSNVVIDHRDVPRHEMLYGDQDLFVMPRRFGGLCLPQQEALSVGMPTLMTDVSPQNTFLPAELLVSAREVDQIMTRTMIGIYEADPRDIAQRIDWLHDNPLTFASLSDWADRWAESMAWDTLRPMYHQVLGI